MFTVSNNVMTKIISFLAIISLTSFTAIDGTKVFAGGCSNHTNNKTKVNCDEDDTKCIRYKKESRKSIRS